MNFAALYRTREVSCSGTSAKLRLVLTSTTMQAKDSHSNSSTSTAIIVHPTFEKGILSAIIPSFQKERNIVIDFCKKRPQLYLIRQGERGSSDNVGLVSWPSGIYLAKYFASMKPDTFKNANVIEIGCGCCPLPSMVLAELGANVVATDGYSSVLNLSRENIHINWSRNLHDPGSKIPETRLLEWGENDAVNQLSRTKSFDYIVAADVIYYEKVHTKLITTLSKLSHAGTRIFIAFQIRLHAFEGTFFTEKLPASGFSSSVVWTSGTEPQVKIAEIRKM